MLKGLPLTDPDITVGPVLSHEDRILLVAKDDVLAEREAASIEDLANRRVTYTPEFPREMMDAFVPPVTPSGQPVRRVASHSVEEIMMRVAIGEQAHPTVRSFVEHLSHPGIASVPIRDLPPSETALAWLTDNRSPKIQALAHAARDVLAQTELAAYQPTNGADDLRDLPQRL